jgi:hypothetical protein
MYVPSILGVIPAMLLLVAASLVLGDEPEAENARAARALEHAKQEMSALKIRESVRGGEEFHLVGEPVLKWSNPIRGSLHGAVYIWTLKGRPVVVGSFLEWFVPEKSRWIELHSLAIGRHRGGPRRRCIVCDRPCHRPRGLPSDRGSQGRRGTPVAICPGALQ